MLAPESSQLRGTLALIRVEDWLRGAPGWLRPSPPDRVQARQILEMRTEEFISHFRALRKSGTPTWFLSCPSRGWFSTEYSFEILCQSYTNLLSARVQRLAEAATLDWPGLLLPDPCEDREADRLEHIAFTGEAFDQLGAFLGRQLARAWTSGDAGVSSMAELTAYLAGLGVEVLLVPATAGDRPALDRLLRTAASFSLTGEHRDLSDADLDALFASEHCLLIKVSDRLSNYGTSGLMAFRPERDRLRITSLALSCTVLGKQVEYAMVSALAREASQHGFRELAFQYQPSKRNQPMLGFLQSLADAQGSAYVLPVGEAENRLRAARFDAGASTAKWEGRFPFEALSENHVSITH